MDCTLIRCISSRIQPTFLLVLLSILCYAKTYGLSPQKAEDLLNPQSTKNFKMDTWKYQKKFVFTEDTASDFWKRGTTINYDPKHFNGKNIYVHVIPWSHTDPGYKSSYTNTFNSHINKIITSVVNALSANPKRRFIWAESSTLQRWYGTASNEMKDALKTLIKSGQLEIVSGGWVMPEESLTHYEALLDELMEGHDWLIRALGVRPTTGFSMDSIGHSPVMGYILKKSGLKGTVINKIHYAYKRELAANRSIDFMWTPTWSDSPDDKLFTHVHPFIGFDIPHSCGPNPEACSSYDFTIVGKETSWGNTVRSVKMQNIEVLADTLVDQYRQQAMLFRTNHIPVFLGGMSYYESEKELGTQLDSYQMLFDHINNDPQYKMRVSFSNLSYWFDSVFKSKFYPKNEGDMPIVRGDFFNYADNGNDFWTGHYSTRTFFKKFSRSVGTISKSVNSLFALLTAFGREPSDKADLPIVLQRTRRSIALYQNHHGISGVSSKAAMREYIKNMHDARWKLKNALLLLTQYALSREGFPTTSVGEVFELSEKKKRFNEIITPEVIKIPESTEETRTLVFYNNLPHTRAEYVSIRANTPDVEVRNADGDIITAQVCPSLDSGQDKFSISTTAYTVTFPVRVPALGITSVFISRVDDEENSNIQRCEIIAPSSTMLGTGPIKGAKSLRVLDASEPMCLRNSEISICVNKSTGLINTVNNGINKNSNNGGYEKFEEEYAMYSTNTQNDGQVLMSVTELGKAVNVPTKNVMHAMFRGIYTDEHVYQTGGRVRVARLIKDTSVVNGINSLGLRYVDISIKDFFREDALSMRIKTGVKGRKDYRLKFVTDINGFGYSERAFRKDLPNSANFFPVTTSLRIQDRNQREAFLVGQPMGATCYKTLEDTVTCEFILDRKTHSDDKKGIPDKVEDGVPTLADFRISFESPDSSELLDSPTTSELSHALGMRLNNPLNVGVGIVHKPASWKKSLGVEIAPLTSDLPLDVEIPSFQVATSALGAGEVALTIARHIVGRHVTQRSQKDEVCISLTDLFKCAQVVDVTEHTLTYLHDLSDTENAATMDGTVCIQKGSIHSYTFNVRVDQDCRANSMASPRLSKWVVQGETGADNAGNANEDPFNDITFDDNVPPGIPEYQAKNFANDNDGTRHDDTKKKGNINPLDEDMFDEKVDFDNFNEDKVKTVNTQQGKGEFAYTKHKPDEDDNNDEYHIDKTKPFTDKKGNDKDENVANTNNYKIAKERDDGPEEEENEIGTNRQQNTVNLNNNINSKPTGMNTKYKDAFNQIQLPFPIEKIDPPTPDTEVYNRDRSTRIQLGIITVSLFFLVLFFLFIKRVITSRTFSIILVATAFINTLIFLV